MKSSSNQKLRTVAVTGISGFIGSHLLVKLRDRKDLKIRALVHKNHSNVSNERNIDIVKGDLFDLDGLREFPTKDCTLINLVYPQSGSTEESLRAIDNLGTACVDAKIKRLIHCSTAVVAGRVSENPIDEETKCNPVSAYEIEKFNMEKLLIDKYGNFFEVIILRPTAVFGPGGKNLMKMTNYLKKGNRFINYIRSCLYNYRKMNLIYVENVVAALMFLVEYEGNRSNKGIFIASDDNDMMNEYRKIELSMLSLFGKKDYSLPILPIPLCFLGQILKLSGRTNYRPLSIYNNQKLRDIGFRNIVSLRDGLNEFISWYNSNHSF